MSKNTKKQTTKQPDKPFVREPWIQKNRGLFTIAIVSVALAILVGYQIIKGSGTWGQAILWGLVFGGTVWLVFYGMTWFHSLFNKKN
ncbi:MAG: hypothetical protein WA116_04540 [Anaerolineaceae bacterium]